MLITDEWIAEHKPCRQAIKWWDHTERVAVKIARALIAESKLDWANWLVTKVLEHHELVEYAIFAAEQALPVFEDKHPHDKRPREAIDAAKRVLEDDTPEKRVAADAAAYAADAAAYAARAAAYAARAAAYAAAHAAARAADAAHAADAADAAHAAYADELKWSANKVRERISWTMILERMEA